LFGLGFTYTITNTAILSNRRIEAGLGGYSVVGHIHTCVVPTIQYYGTDDKKLNACTYKTFHIATYKEYGR